MSRIERLPDRSQRDRGDECSCRACNDVRPLIEALDLGDAGPADHELLGRAAPDHTYDEARRAGQEDLF